MSMHINEDRESQLLLVGLEKRVMRYRLAAPLGLKPHASTATKLEFIESSDRLPYTEN
jgi:hypothetical protein